MMILPEITIITLMGGRFHTIEPYLFSLDNIDYPKENLKIVWMTNCDDEIFRKLLLIEAEKREKSYKDFKVEFVDDIPTSPMVVEEGIGSDEHANIIAKLYNRILKLVDTEYFFSLEDDVGIPSYTLKRLLTHFENPNTVYATGAIFDRHKGGLFAWNVMKMRRIVSGSDKKMTTVEDYVGVPIKKPWGIQKVGLSTLGLSLIKTNAVKQIGNNPFKPKHSASISLIGCDMCLCLDFEIRGLDRIIDFDVRSLHYDSKRRPH